MKVKDVKDRLLCHCSELQLYYHPHPPYILIPDIVMQDCTVESLSSGEDKHRKVSSKAKEKTCICDWFNRFSKQESKKVFIDTFEHTGCDNREMR